MTKSVPMGLTNRLASPIQVTNAPHPVSRVCNQCGSFEPIPALPELNPAGTKKLPSTDGGMGRAEGKIVAVQRCL